MDSIRDEYLTTSVREVRLSAREIIRHHEYCIEALARPSHRRLYWGPMWFIGEAPKRSHVASCQSFSRLATIWRMLQLRAPAQFRDLTDQPMPKSYSRWGDIRPRRIDSALGARKLLRESVGLSGSATSDLFVVLLGSTVREAFGAQHLHQYRWYSLPRTENVLGELFLASIPHPSPLASRVFDTDRVAQMLNEVHYAQVRRPIRARGCGQIERLGLIPLEK